MQSFGEILGQWGIAAILLAAMLFPPLVVYWIVVRGVKLMSDNNSSKLYAAHVETAGNLDKSPWLTLDQWRIMELGLKEAKKQGKIVDYVKVTKEVK